MHRRHCIASLCLITLGSLLLASRAAVAERGSNEPAQAVHTVRLIIDYGDGVQKHFIALAWKRDMTALDAMTAAQASSHGIQFQHTGSGATAFLTGIDDLENEGRGKRNWIFWVNTSLADKSFGAYKLEPSDVVTWKYSGQQIK